MDAFARVEDLSLVVDDAAVGGLRHRAASERVHGHHVVMEQLRPDGIAYIGASERAGRIVERGVDPGEHLLSAGAWPFDARAAVLQHHPATGVVMRHHEERHRVLERADVRPGDEALELPFALLEEVPHAAVGVAPDQGGRSFEDAREQRRDRSRHHSVFDHHPAAELGLFARVDDAGDARPDHGQLARRMVPPADPADGFVAVVREREHVAVAREALAEPIRQLESFLA